MKKLAREERVRIIDLLCEGSSIRAVTRLTGASKNTVIKLMIDAGRACAAYHDEHVYNLQSKRIQVDEIWTFTYTKQGDLPLAKSAPEGVGDTWTWTAIDADSKLIVSWFVGDHDSQSAIAFLDDLRSRLSNCVQLTSDGHRAYLEAVEATFGSDIDYAQLGIRGDRDPEHVSTSFAKRQHLNLRMHKGTNAFSKKLENHARLVALFTTFYNFARIHKALRVSPAMAAGVSDRLWHIGDIVTLLEAAEPKPKKRGPYRKRNSD
jgi:hypothetical protein